MNRPVSQKQHRRKNSDPNQEVRPYREEEDLPEGNFQDQDFNNDYQDRARQQKPSTSQTKKRNFIVQTNSRPYSAKPNQLKGNPFPNQTGDKFPGALGGISQESKQTLEAIRGPIANNYPPAGDNQKYRAKYIPQDKERLYEEGIHLKNTVNALKEENIRLKTRINTLEKEANKFEKMVMQRATQMENVRDNKSLSESYLTITLKQQIKEVRAEMKQKENELLEIKRSMKYTKIQELEMQVRAFSDETMRLKNYLDHVMKEQNNTASNQEEFRKLQEEYFAQSHQIVDLKRDNEDMAQAIRMLEDQNFNLNKSNEEIDKWSKKEIAQLKKSVIEKEKEIQRLKNELFGGPQGAYAVQKKPIHGIQNNHQDFVRQELERKDKEIALLAKQLTEKEKLIVQQQKELKDAKQAPQEKRDPPKETGIFAQSSYQRSPTENQKKPGPQPTQPVNDNRNKGYSPKINKSNHEIEEDLPREQQLKRPSDQDPKLRPSPIQQQQKQSDQPKIQVEQPKKNDQPQQGQASNNKPEQIKKLDEPPKKKEEPPKKKEEPKQIEEKVPQQTKPTQQQQPPATKPVAKIPRVNTSDVAQIALELNLRFRLHRLTFHELEYHLASEAGVGSEDELNIKQLTELLQKDPFYVSEKADAHLLARYLIEEPKEDSIVYTDQIHKTLENIIEKLKKIVGDVTFTTAAQEHHLFHACSEKLKKYRETFEIALSSASNNEFFTRKTFLSTCKTLELQFSEEEVDYIICRVFAVSDSLKHLPIETLLEIFVDHGEEEEEKLQHEEDEENMGSGDYEEDLDKYGANKYDMEPLEEEDEHKEYSPQKSEMSNVKAKQDTKKAPTDSQGAGSKTQTKQQNQEKRYNDHINDEAHNDDESDYEVEADYEVEEIVQSDEDTSRKREEAEKLKKKKEQEDEANRKKKQAEEDEARRKKQQQADEEEARKQKQLAAEEEARRQKKLQEEEQARKKKQQADEEEAKRQKQLAAEEEARRKKQQADEEEAKRQKQLADEEEAQKKKKQADEEEVVRLKNQQEEEEARRKKQQADEEEAKRQKQLTAEEEARRKKQQADEEDARRQKQLADEEEAQKKKQQADEEEVRRQKQITAEKEAIRLKQLANEEEARKKKQQADEEEAAKLKQQQEEEEEREKRMEELRRQEEELEREEELLRQEEEEFNRQQALKQKAVSEKKPDDSARQKELKHDPSNKEHDAYDDEDFEEPEEKKPVNQQGNQNQGPQGTLKKNDDDDADFDVIEDEF